VDPYLQGESYPKRARTLTGFAARVRNGGYGSSRKVKGDTVSTALSALGQEIHLLCGVNPMKAVGSNNFVPRVAKVLDGMRKDDGPVLKKLPVEADVVEYLVKLGMLPGALPLVTARGDLSLGANYYLLRSVEYTSRPGRQAQTVTFRIKDMHFFAVEKNGKLRQLPMNAPDDEEILRAHICTMKIEHQKNGWWGVCISHEANGDEIFCPIRAMGRRYVHIYKNLPISTYFENGKKKFISDNSIRVGLKEAAAVLGYPKRGIPIKRIDTGC
jgi:hypothetical protein